MVLEDWSSLHAVMCISTVCSTPLLLGKGGADQVVKLGASFHCTSPGITLVNTEDWTVCM